MLCGGTLRSRWPERSGKRFQMPCEIRASGEHCWRIKVLSTDRFSFSFLQCYLNNAGSKTTISPRRAACTPVAFKSTQRSEFDLVPQNFNVYTASMYEKRPSSNHHKANRGFEHNAGFDELQSINVYSLILMQWPRIGKIATKYISSFCCVIHLLRHNWAHAPLNEQGGGNGFKNGGL